MYSNGVLILYRQCDLPFCIFSIEHFLIKFFKTFFKIQSLFQVAPFMVNVQKKIICLFRILLYFKYTKGYFFLYSVLLISKLAFTIYYFVPINDLRIEILLGLSNLKTQ